MAVVRVEWLVYFRDDRETANIDGEVDKQADTVDTWKEGGIFHRTSLFDFPVYGASN